MYYRKLNLKLGNLHLNNRGNLSSSLTPKLISSLARKLIKLFQFNGAIVPVTNLSQGRLEHQCWRFGRRRVNTVSSHLFIVTFHLLNIVFPRKVYPFSRVFTTSYANTWPRIYVSKGLTDGPGFRWEVTF